MDSRTIRRALLGGTALSLAATVVPVAAQDASDIIVTARRVEERLQDVPISIAVFDQKTLTNRNVASIADLAVTTPSLQSNPLFGNDNALFSIRGFSQESFTASTVAVYFADVVAPRGGTTTSAGEGAGPGSFFDLQNVQVLKGPQGTLFGRNTTGGAILLVPKKPGSRFGGYVEGSYGNYDMKRVQAVLNVPLNDSARFRIGVDHMDRDGYLKSNTGIGPSRFNDIDYTAARASLVLNLTPDIENYTIGTYSVSKNNGVMPTITQCDPNVVINSGAVKNGNPPAPSPLVSNLPAGALSCAQIARQKAAGGFYRVENSLEDARNKTETWQIINTTTWTASDNLTLKNIAAYGEIRAHQSFDIFGTRWLVPQPGQAPVSPFYSAVAGFGQTTSVQRVSPQANGPNAAQSTFTDEVQVQGRAFANKLTYQVGGIIELSNPLETIGFRNQQFIICPDVNTGNCFGPYGLLSNLTVAATRQYFRDKGVYAQASYDVTDKLRVTGGIRYTADLSRAVSKRLFTRYSADGSFRLQSCDSADATLPTCFSPKLKQSSKAPTWLIDIDYKPIEDVLVYAKYARGYRQGLTFAQGALRLDVAAGSGSNQPYRTFGPEKLDSYEGGLKASWHGPVPGLFNFAGFYNKFIKQQYNLSWRKPQIASGVTSEGSGYIWGLEAEANATFFQSLNLSASGTYLQSKIKSLGGGTLSGPNLDIIAPAPPQGYTPANFVPVQVPGFDFAFAPRFKYTVSGIYTLPVSDDAGKIAIGATWSHTSSYQTQSTVLGRVRPYGTLNLNFNWNGVVGSPFDLSLFATNVLAKHYFIYRQDQIVNLGLVSSTFGEPRMYGVRLKYRFGGERS